MIDLKKLKAMSMFQDLTDSELEEAGQHIFEKEYHSGNVLFHEGMAGGILYLLVSGKVEIFRRVEGQEIILASLGPGDFVGEMSLIDDEPRSASARVTEDASLLVVTKKSFFDIIEINPEGANKILLNLLRILSHRLRDTNRRLTL